MRTFIAICLVCAVAGAVHGQVAAEELLPGSLRWLVRFDDSLEKEQIESFGREWGLAIHDPGPYARHYRIEFQLPPRPELIEELISQPEVLILEREARYATTALAPRPVSNDPLRKRQWSLDMIKVDQAMLINFGSDPGVCLAVLDTGVAYADSGRFRAAPDLEGTIILPGFDFAAEDEEPLDEGDGQIGHGTMMAGIIAQTTFNARGGAGIAFNASLLPVRVVNRHGIARAGDVARGIRYSVANGAAVIVLGFSGPRNSRILSEAIDEAAAQGVAVIAPAGNSRETGWPARHAAVLSVGALDAGGEPAKYSPVEGPIDLYAPGGDLEAGVDSNGDGLPDGILVNTFSRQDFGRHSYIYVDGTSAAAAHAAAVAALVLSDKGAIGINSLRKRLLDSPRVDGTPMLNAFRALSRAGQTFVRLSK